MECQECSQLRNEYLRWDQSLATATMNLAIRAEGSTVREYVALCRAAQEAKDACKAALQELRQHRAENHLAPEVARSVFPQTETGAT